MKFEDCFKIAYIVKTHGLKGEVTLSLSAECPDLHDVDSLFLDVRGQLVPHFVQSVSMKGAKAFIKLEGINTLEDAFSLKGSSVYLSKKMRPSQPRGKFYNDEVVGFEVTDLVQGPLGFVKEVQENGANRHLIVLYLGREIMIPLNGPFIKGVNKTAKRFSVELPDGFLDI